MLPRWAAVPRWRLGLRLTGKLSSCPSARRTWMRSSACQALTGADSSRVLLVSMDLIEGVDELFTVLAGDGESFVHLCHFHAFRLHEFDDRLKVEFCFRTALGNMDVRWRVVERREGSPG